MQEINLEQFEMTNESMSKVLGGAVSTNGIYISQTDEWCETDSGEPGSHSVKVSNCHQLNEDGTWD